MTADKRAQAATAVSAIRAWLADSTKGGERGVIHVDFGRPRRGVWFETWSNLPGLMHDLASNAWLHALLPGWQYTAAEMRTEMIDDLAHFAATGEQPTQPTRGANA